MEFLRELLEWTAAWAHTPYGGAALFAVAFAEASFFPIPPDVLLIPLSLARTSQALIFAAIATMGSLLGGILGFFIGDKGGRPLLQRFFKPEKVEMVQRYYRRYDVWAVGMGCLYPDPVQALLHLRWSLRVGFQTISSGIICGPWRSLLSCGLGDYSLRRAGKGFAGHVL